MIETFERPLSSLSNPISLSLLSINSSPSNIDIDAPSLPSAMTNRILKDPPAVADCLYRHGADHVLLEWKSSFLTCRSKIPHNNLF
jgi:hypothetical protein